MPLSTVLGAQSLVRPGVCTTATRPASPFEGQLIYDTTLSKVLVYNGTGWIIMSGKTNVERFTASGTFTPPAGVTYAIAYIRGGGGGIGASSGAGGTSSVAFAGGTVSATGGTNMTGAIGSGTDNKVAGVANSGQGAKAVDSGGSWTAMSQDGALITAGGAVTASVGITVTVANGGTAGTPNGAAGGTGYVYISYEV